MGDRIRLLGFSGSLRASSHNRQLVEIAAAAARQAGAEVQVVSLADFDLPLYNADREEAEGLPAGAIAFKRALADADGWFIGSPEYNGSISAALKNAIDWASRPGPQPGETPFTLSAFRGKVAGIMSASPGAWGGMRALLHLRVLLSGMFVLVAAEQVAVPYSTDAFDEQGALKNKLQHDAIETIGRRVVRLAAAMKQP